MKRILKGLVSFNRFGELYQCFRSFESPVVIMLAYLKFIRLDYPCEIIYKRKYKIIINDWYDLSTVWVVLVGNEYRIDPNDIIIVDLGANIGVFSILAASECPKAKLIAVEPFPDNYKHLLKNISSNGLQDSIEPVEVAVSKNCGTVEFDNSRSVPGHSRGIQVRGKSEESVIVKSVTLKNLFEEYGIENADFLKIDVEGAEYDVLLNADSPTLEKISRIGLEYHGKGLEPIQLFLESHGFRKTYHPKKGPSGVAEFTRIV